MGQLKIRFSEQIDTPEAAPCKQRLAKARLERLDTLPTVRRRQISRAAMLASLVGDVRRQLSLRAVQQQARLLMDKLAVAGTGIGAAAQRRDWTVQGHPERMRKVNYTSEVFLGPLRARKHPPALAFWAPGA